MNSTDENRGRRAGMFWSIYMTGAVNLIFHSYNEQVLGNTCAFFLLKAIGVGRSTGGPGWNGSTSILFLVLGSK